MLGKPIGKLTIVSASISRTNKAAVYFEVVFSDEKGNLFTSEKSSFYFDLKPKIKDANRT